MAFVSGAGGVPIYVHDPNPNGKKAIVFLHGWPLSHAMYEYQYSRLRDYRCVGIDFRGFGRSGAPTGSYSYDQLADDVLRVVRTLNLRRFTLVGFSMGGAVALRYMRRHRGRGVEKAAFLAAAAPVFTQRPDFPYGMTKQQVDDLINQCKENRPQMLQGFGELFFGQEHGSAFKLWSELINLDASAEGTQQCLYALRDEDCRADIEAVKVPTAIFHGKLDKVCAYALGEQLHEMLPGSELHTFENSGHAVFYDELTAFNQVFLPFVTA